ncbi:MAG: integrase arm-type DNA-binding domain-containing protein [Pseudomonadota bacterium]
MQITTEPRTVFFDILIMAFLFHSHKRKCLIPLTDVSIRAEKLREKAYKLPDSKGLYLLVTATGKYFRFDYRFNEKRKTLALGVYPDTTLAKAREKHLVARQQLANDVDPCELKKINKRARTEQAANSFEAVGREWLATMVSSWKKSHSEKVINRLEKDIFPYIGSKPISQITAPELLVVLKRIEGRGAVDTAHRAKHACSQIFRYAIQVGGRAERDPATDLRGGLQTVKSKNFATIIEPEKIGELLRAIDGYTGSFIVKCALSLAPLVFVRPGELRHAEWQEIDLERREWRIPGEKMKRGQNT